MQWVYLINGIYGAALALLIWSWKLSEAPIRLFVAEDYSLGTHGQVWKDWNAVGCAFVAAINACAWSMDFNAVALRAVALCTAGIYGIWALQNARLLVSANTPYVKPLMWIHALLCGTCAALAGCAALSFS